MVRLQTFNSFCCNPPPNTKDKLARPPTKNSGIPTLTITLAVSKAQTFPLAYLVSTISSIYKVY